MLKPHQQTSLFKEITGRKAANESETPTPSRPGRASIILGIADDILRFQQLQKNGNDEEKSEKERRSDLQRSFSGIIKNFMAYFEGDTKAIKAACVELGLDYKFISKIACNSVPVDPSRQPGIVLAVASWAKSKGADLPDIKQVTKYDM